MEAKHTAPPLQFQTADGRSAQAAKLIKAPMTKTYSALRSRCADNDELAQLLIEADPEIDMQAAGRKTGPTDRILLDPDGNVLYATSELEVIFDTAGREIERRQPADTPANIDTDTPLLWTGKTIKRSEAVRRYVFSRSYQIRHVDGLTFDFLFGIAATLNESDSVALVGTGQHGGEPILLERNGLPYRGFLEGRVNNEKYMLLLHLSRMELVSPQLATEGCV